MIPWVLSDTNYVRGPHQRLDTSWTVFVGGLHGMLNAGMFTSVFIKFEILSLKSVFI